MIKRWFGAIGYSSAPGLEHERERACGRALDGNSPCHVPDIRSTQHAGACRKMRKFGCVFDFPNAGADTMYKSPHFRPPIGC
jgi:hypothetical protein